MIWRALGKLIPFLGRLSGPSQPGSGNGQCSSLAVNDGKPHAVVVRRASGTVTITVDGATVGSAASAANLGALTTLLIAGDPCVGVDGTMAFTGSVTDVCVSR